VDGDPFRITGPSVVSFSGGRTSGYMLWRILQAHGGTLPDDVLVLFQNTGREMPATLDFVQECSTRWGAPVTWLEYDRKPGAPTYRVVNHNSASRNGEPFRLMLEAKPMLPNPVSRFCTIELKIRTAKRYIMAERGWKRWTNIVGLRADERRRVERATDPARNKKDRWDVRCPLADADITVSDVAAFWRTQPFDLRLKGKWEGNCDGCFLKSRAALSRIMLDYPERAQWWADQEAVPRGNGAGATFRADREDYTSMIRAVRDQGALRFDETMIEGGQECGMECGA
jgi:3'-phosphoadenosine 5'-phosphosulfate sulfotransferase (PAPS reductase)/FAD synthetase